MIERRGANANTVLDYGKVTMINANEIKKITIKSIEKKFEKLIKTLNEYIVTFAECGGSNATFRLSKEKTEYMRSYYTLKGFRVIVEGKFYNCKTKQYFWTVNVDWGNKLIEEAICEEDFSDDDEESDADYIHNKGGIWG